MRTTERTVLEVKEDSLYLNNKKLLDFVPYIADVKEIITSNGRKLSYRIRICKKGQIIEDVWVPQLYIKSWFALSFHCSDADISDKDRRLIEAYLQKQVSELPFHREIHLDKSGWKILDSGKIFYNKYVISDAVTDTIKTERETKIIRTEDYKFNALGTENILYEIQQVAKKSSWIVYMASYFDMLKELFQRAGYPAEFILNIYGKSGSGKTSLVKTICSPLYVFSFSQPQRRDTLMKEIEKLEGCTVLMDDYHPTESRADYERQNAIKDSLVRLVEANNSAPNIMITSEYLDGKFSAQDREIQIFLENTLDWKCLTALDEKKELLEEIRTAFCVQILKNENAVIANIKNFCLEADRKHISNGCTSFRSNRYLDYIRCVGFLFQKYFCCIYGIKFQWNDMETDIQMQLERQNRHMEIIKEQEHQGTFLITLKNMLKAPGILQNIPDGKEFAASADTIHIDSQRRLYIAPKTLLLGMKRYLQTNNIPVKKIVNELKTADALVTYEKGNELTIKYNGKRCYVIDIDSLEEYCNLFA